MEFTGERFVPEVHGNIELEHLHRYLFACKVVEGKTVLDIASGEGYGSAMLAQTAYKVTGVDISQEAVSHAQAKYQIKNLDFRLGSCSAIPLEDASVDVVVSFETIEHHVEHEAMMQEIKRVLRPGGVLVISSPDKLEYSEKPGFSNPHHVKELYRDEFIKLLDLHFINHRISGQRVVYGSAIFIEDSIGPVESYELVDNALSAISGVSHAVYLVAVASDAELPCLSSGVLEQPIEDTELTRFWRELMAERDGQIHNLTQTLGERDGQIVGLNQAIDERDGQIIGLNRAIDEGDGQIRSLTQTIGERDGQIHKLTQTIGERDGQIDKLTQTIGERDGQIVNLNQ
ncbi:MAG: class I SAM-dependent methyltransferase, partial [Methylococcales bacterium]|nr:class I SAM-dependent methyltransferase [Methylococcales bacterium]